MRPIREEGSLQSRKGREVFEMERVLMAFTREIEQTCPDGDGEVLDCMASK